MGFTRTRASYNQNRPFNTIDSFPLSGDIPVAAEMIIVSAGVAITEAANVNLTAVAGGSTSGAGPSAAAVVSAQVQVDGTISASGDVVLSAVANNCLVITMPQRQRSVSWPRKMTALLV